MSLLLIPAPGACAAWFTMLKLCELAVVCVPTVSSLGAGLNGGSIPCDGPALTILVSVSVRDSLPATSVFAVLIEGLWRIFFIRPRRKRGSREIVLLLEYFRQQMSMSSRYRIVRKHDVVGPIVVGRVMVAETIYETVPFSN